MYLKHKLFCFEYLIKLDLSVNRVITNFVYCTNGDIDIIF